MTLYPNKFFGGGKNAPDAPTGKGYTKIYSTHRAFAALKADGSITAWGELDSSWGDLDRPWGRGGKRKNKITNAPTDKGYTKVYSNENAFAALKDDKSIMAWGNPSNGGKKVPVAIDLGYTKIYSNEYAFAVLKPMA